MSRTLELRLLWAEKMRQFVSPEWLARNVVGLSEEEYQRVRHAMLYEPSAIDLLGALSEKES